MAYACAAWKFFDERFLLFVDKFVSIFIAITMLRYVSLCICRWLMFCIEEMYIVLMEQANDFYRGIVPGHSYCILKCMYLQCT